MKSFDCVTQEEEIIDESREPSHVQQREQGKSGRRHLDGGGDDEDGTINAHAAENSMMFSMSGNNFVAHSIMMGQVDPLQWMEETERVTPKLLAQKQKMMQMGMSEWNAHIDLLKKYDSAVRAADKLNGSQSKPQQHLLPTVLSDDLKHLGNGIKECLEGIQRSERLLNSNESCSLSSLHYSTIQKVQIFLHILAFHCTLYDDFSFMLNGVAGISHQRRAAIYTATGD